MNTLNTETPMPPAMLVKLEAVRRRGRKVSLLSGFLRGVAILLAAMVLAMLIDWLVGFYDKPWRWALTLTALTAGVAGLIHGCLLPLLRSRSLASVAREVDRANPALEERFETLTGFARSDEAPEFRGSEAMRRKIAEQAAAMSSRVAPESIISKDAISRAGKFLAVVCAVLALWFAVDFARAKTLCARFWAPGSDFSLTQLFAKTGDVVVGMGDPVTLETTEQGNLTDLAKFYIRSAKGRDDMVELARTVAPAPGFVYTQNEVTESFDYRTRAGDGQTPWHHVTVRERPKITEAKLR